MIMDLAAQHALDHLAKSGVNGLTEQEKTLAAVWLFEAGVGNDGFRAYFGSYRGDLAAEAPAALHAIGAHQLADIAAEANAVFGPDGPPSDRNVRRALVARLPESARNVFAALEDRYDACDEDADELLERFLQSSGQ